MPPSPTPVPLPHGLPGREGLIAWLDRPSHQRCSLLLIDLDQFHHFNKRLGHPAGDHILSVTAQRLLRALPPGACLAHLGADRFGIALGHDTDGSIHAEAGAVQAVAIQILRRLQVPIHIDPPDSASPGDVLHLDACIGIATQAQGRRGEETLLQAEAALHKAKSAGKGSIHRDTPMQGSVPGDPRDHEARLRDAITRDEFVLHFQPQFRCTDGTLVAVEALLHWTAADAVRRPPLERLAETCGMQPPLDTWALQAACRQLAAWRAEGIARVRLAVKVSAAQFGRPELADILGDLLRAHSIEPGCLELEIAEAGLRDTVSASPRLWRLRSLGVHLSIDRFGIGQSTLPYLSYHLVHKLRIEAGLIARLPRDGSAQAIVDSALRLGHLLELETVADGVTDAAQLEHLRQHLCFGAQGPLWGEPVPAEVFTPRLRQLVAAAR